MGYRRRIYFTEKQKTEIWDRWQRGESMSSIGRRFDRNSSSIYPVLARTGGIRPAARRSSLSAPELANFPLFSQRTGNGRAETGSQKTVPTANILVVLGSRM